MRPLLIGSQSFPLSWDGFARDYSPDFLKNQCGIHCGTPDSSDHSRRLMRKSDDTPTVPLLFPQARINPTTPPEDLSEFFDGDKTHIVGGLGKRF
jgi:hypothetical protein